MEQCTSIYEFGFNVNAVVGSCRIFPRIRKSTRNLAKPLQLRSGPSPEGGTEGRKNGNQQSERRSASLPAELRQH
jgi:hypothetical protein